MAFLFTIEQIELVRRLRKTGMSKEQVWKAYEEMDRLDSEFNGSGGECLDTNTVKNNANTVPNVPKQAKTVCSPTVPQIEFNTNSMHEICAKTVASYSRSGSQQSLQSQNNSYSMERSADGLPPLPQGFNISALSSGHGEANDNEEPSATNEPSVTITPIPSTPIDSSSYSQMQMVRRPSMTVYYGAEEPPELLEFKKKGEPLMLNEIRGFVNKYNIRQIMIAEMTKLSQGYVSRFFRGEGQEMSEKSKNLIYLWYLSCRSRPEILTQFCPQTIGERRTQLSEAGDMMPIRRDRFIFRKEHLVVLDKYFKVNPYPDASSKEMIAEECNAFVERTTHRLLKDRDKVTISVVSNWFNNKRKEAKTKRLPTNLAIMGSELDNNAGATHSMPFITETGLYSNQSSCSVEELETRPDLSMIFSEQDSLELSDEAEGDSHHSDDQNNGYINGLKNNFSIKIEPTY